MSIEHRGIKVMNDYCVRWPLWWTRDVGFATADELGLTEALTNELLEWAAHFDAHFDHLAGWDSPEARAHHATVADDVVTRLRAELGPDVPLQVDLWELG